MLQSMSRQCKIKRLEQKHALFDLSKIKCGSARVTKTSASEHFANGFIVEVLHPTICSRVVIRDGQRDGKKKIYPRDE